MSYLRRPFLYSASMRSPSHSPARTSIGFRNQTTAISRRRSHCSCESRAGTRPVRLGFLSPLASDPYAGRGMGDESSTAVDMAKVYPLPNCLAIQIPCSYYTKVTCNQIRTRTERTLDEYSSLAPFHLSHRGCRRAHPIRRRHSVSGPQVAHAQIGSSPGGEGVGEYATVLCVATSRDERRARTQHEVGAGNVSWPEGSGGFGET